MALLHWKHRYDMQYQELDEQHRDLLGLLNELIVMASGPEDPAGLGSVFSRLCSYVHTHFATEERYLAACGSPGLARQQREHAWFVEQLLSLNDTHNAGDSALHRETLKLLKRWFLDHILGSDLACAQDLKNFYATAPIRGVIFDFGNVISRFDNRRFLAALGALCGRDPQELGRLLYRESTLTQDFERGDLTPAAFTQGVAELCGQPLEEKLLAAAYCDIFTPIPETAALIRRLKPRYRLGLLSNTNLWHFRHAIAPGETFRLFDGVTLSFQARALKPDPQVYREIVAKLDLMAEECVFVDDRADLVAAANDQLLHGLTYTGPEALEADLARLGVLTQ